MIVDKQFFLIRKLPSLRLYESEKKKNEIKIT